MLAVAILLAAVCQVKAQTLPATDGTYYYIQFKRGTNLVLENQGTAASPANQIKTADLVVGKAQQLWKFVDAGNGAYYIVSKALDANNSEVAISWDATTSRYIAAPYSVATSTKLYFISTGITTNAAYLPAFVIGQSATATQAMNPVGGSDVGKTIGEWFKNDDGDALVFKSSKAVLNDALVSANAFYNGGSGLNPGNYPTEAKATLKGSIDAAQSVYNNAGSTDADFTTAAIALKTAITTYSNSPVIMPVVSTPGNEKWYFFQGTRPANTYLTSQGAGANLKSTGVIPNETQLWKIVANTNGTADGYALVNKATGEYLNADIANNTQLNTKTAMPTLNIKFNTSNIFTNGVARFWVENTGTTSASTTGFTFRLHAGDPNVLNWYGNRTDNSSWLLMDYSLSLKVFLKDAIATAQGFVNNAPVGTTFGTYPSDAKGSLSDAIAPAQAVYDNTTATDDVVKSATVTINSVIAAFKLRFNDNAASTVAAPKWFFIRNINRANNQVITTNGKAENDALICEAKSTTNEQLWCFVKSANGSLKLVNRAKPTLAIQDLGYNVQVKLVATANATDFNIATLGTGYMITSLAGNELHCADDSRLVTWNDVAGTASNWLLEEVAQTAQTITFPAISAKTTTDAAFSLAATTDAAGLTVTYTSSNPAVATISGSTVTIVGEGYTDITATQGGNAIYAAATSVTNRLTVSPSVATGVNNTSDCIRIVIKDRMITVAGTNAPIKVLTVSGCVVDAKKQLNQGIYIVKVAGKTVKVDVQ